MKIIVSCSPAVWCTTNSGTLCTEKQGPISGDWGCNCNFNQMLSLQRCYCTELVQMTYFTLENIHLNGHRHVALLQTSSLGVQFQTAFDLISNPI